MRRPGNVIRPKLRSDDPVLRQGYALRFIDKVALAPHIIAIGEPIRPLASAVGSDPDHRAPTVPSLLGTGA